MQNHRTSLDVTLVCGLRGSGKSAFARALVGASTSDSVPARWDPTSVDNVSAPEFALELADHLCDLADDGVSGRVVVELNPSVDAVEAVLVLEAVFAARDPELVVTRLDDVVTMVDVSHVRTHFFSEGVQNPEDYDTGESLARQVEIATMVVINGGDNVPAQEYAQVVALVEKLNPLARLQSGGEPMSTRDSVRGQTHLRPPAGQGMGWMLELSGRAGLPRTVSGISTVVFRDPRPFHPGRLAEVVDSCLGPDVVGTILRSRGLTRLASRPHTVGGWASTGRVLSLEPTSMSSWDPDSPLGQELVFVGLDLRPDALCAVLGAALLDGDELIAGPMEWATYFDAFPEWDVDHRH